MRPENMDSFEGLIDQLVAIRPKEYRPKDFTPTRDLKKGESGDDKK